MSRSSRSDRGRHVRVEVDGVEIVNAVVDDFTYQRTTVDQGRRAGFRVHRPADEYVLTYRVTRDER